MMAHVMPFLVLAFAMAQGKTRHERKRKPRTRDEKLYDRYSRGRS